MSFFERGVGNILAALTVVGWVRYARTVRGEALIVKKKEYIEAAKVIGLPDTRILLKHVLPNVLTSVIVLSTIQVGSFILTEATLSFLGLGVPVTRPSLGMLCSNGFKVLYSGLWWVSIFPGLYIMLIVFGINLFGDFLRDEFNPRLK
jgi:peptide/nickel transport system permease protein